MSKKVLIVCYTFPPMLGVGGRRWAKYAKYLRRLGWKVFVISGSPEQNDQSPWTEDIDGVEVMRLPNRYPAVLNKTQLTLIEKIAYKISLFVVKLCSKGNYYDRGLFWKKQLTEKVEEILKKEDINKLIISGAPFSLLTYGVEIKKKHPNIFYLADIRDHWTHDKFYGFGGLSESRKGVERNALSSVLEVADAIWVPYPEVKADFEKKYKDGEKIQVVPHAVDEDYLIPNTNSKNEAFNLVNFGSIHAGQEGAMLRLAESIENCKGDIKLDFYTSNPKYKEVFESRRLVPTKVEYHAPVTQIRVNEILRECAAGLIFVPDEFRNNLSTKFFEIIGMRVPLVCIGESGDVSAFITSENLGIFIHYNDIDTKVNGIIDELRNFNYNSNYDYSKCTFAFQTQSLIQILEK